jgi:hypothetical protein
MSKKTASLLTFQAASQQPRKIEDSINSYRIELPCLRHCQRQCRCLTRWVTVAHQHTERQSTAAQPSPCRQAGFFARGKFLMVQCVPEELFLQLRRVAQFVPSNRLAVRARLEVTFSHWPHLQFSFTTLLR